MRRTRLRAALLIVVAAAIAGIGWQVSRGVYSQKVRTVKDLGRDFLPKVAQHIRNFRRVKVEHGRAVWEITAQDAQYYEKHDQVVVHEPLVTFYMKDGRRATVAGTEGRLTLKEHELSAFTLSGAVKVDLNGLELTTDQAVYDREHDLITAPGPIVLRGDTLDVYGTGLEIRVTPQQFHVLSNVRTVLKNNNKSNAKAS
jgi:LPS export ABC transporter protein LptC